MNEEKKQEEVVPVVTSLPVVEPVPPVVVPAPAATAPQVVTVEQPKEVAVPPVEPPKNESTTQKAEPPQKKGPNIFLILLILFLFAFVFFLPQITTFITEYQNKKNEEVDASMKSGVTSCYITKTGTNFNTTVETVLTYQKNKLKKTETTTSYKLTDTATDTSVLNEQQQICQNLQGLLAETVGTSINCNVTATVQTTKQTFDYTKFDSKDIEDNIVEYESFYPEYELDQSAVAIRNHLKQAGYTCTSHDS